MMHHEMLMNRKCLAAKIVEGQYSKDDELSIVRQILYVTPQTLVKIRGSKIMGKKFDVLCIGLATVDLLVKPVGKNIFDVDTTKIDKIEVMSGGDAVNQAIILSRLGAKVGMLGKVGGDAFGQLLVEQLKKNGVDTQYVRQDHYAVTNISIVLISKNGERNFIYCNGSNDAFSLNDIDLSLVKQTKMVCIGSIFGLPFLDRGGTAELFKYAKENKVVTAADVTHDANKLGFDCIAEILRNTDVFLPSYVEAFYLTGESVPEKAADVFLRHGVKTVVIKLSEKGCLIKTNTECYRISPYQSEVIDTTGAGDNFTAAFLYGFLDGWDLERCGKFANATGALCIQKLGATTAVSGINQVLSFMKNI